MDTQGERGYKEDLIKNVNFSLLSETNIRLYYYQ